MARLCKRKICGHSRRAHEHYGQPHDTSCALCGCGGWRRFWPF
jgi:hypothetical protein